MDRVAFHIAVGAVAVIASALVIAAMAILLGGLSFLALKSATSESAAVLITAIGLFVAALGIFFGGMAIGRMQPPASGLSSLDEGTLATGISRLVGDGVVEAIQANPRTGTMIALVAGLAVGASPNLRATLRRMI
jgi:hypothetical protein